MAGKQNAMLAKIEAKYAAEYAMKLAEAHAHFQHMLKMGMQQASDAALMAIDDVFDVNEYSAKKFYLAHVKYVNDISNLLIDDGKCDPDLVYSRTDIDRRLLQIVGAENFAPWDERYGEEHG